MGYIHSLETFGTVDGPGVRFVVFFQGCPMRCQYCHNPDTWKIEDGQEMDADEIISRYLRNESFYTTGGITATGGEPMVQIDFLTELFTKAKEHGIHTALDTSGIMFPGVDAGEAFEKVEKLMKVTDLVMLDIKHIDPQEHEKLTAQKIDAVLDFARFLADNGVSIWIRHVLVPGITQDKDQLYKLGRFIGTLKTLKAVDVLPYHDMGKAKYESLGIEYPLEGTPIPSKKDVIDAREIIIKGIADTLKEIKKSDSN